MGTNLGSSIIGRPSMMASVLSSRYPVGLAGTATQAPALRSLNSYPWSWLSLSFSVSLCLKILSLARDCETSLVGDTMLPKMMEPEEFWAFADFLGNRTTPTCLFTRTSSGGIFKGHSLLVYVIPLLILQMSLASITIVVTAIALKPLGQPLMVAQILGGILLGPSFLAQDKTIANALFPLESFIMLDVIAVLGTMFYFFLIGVYMDPFIVKKIGKKAYAIGISAAVGSTILPYFGFYYIYDTITDASLQFSIAYVMRAQTIFTFPIIARYLYELNILNSEFGSVALSSSIVGGLLSFFYELWRNNHNVIVVLEVIRAIAFVLGILFVVMPVALWMIKRNKEGHTASICSIFVAVLVSGFAGYSIGYHIILGPFILGLAIPAGPPLGAALVERLEIIVSWILMPVFFLKIGLAINLHVLQMETILKVGFIILIGFFAKSSGACLAGLCCKLPWMDALSVSLVINVKGALELTIVKATRRRQELNYESFVIMCTSMVITTMVVTFLLRASHSPSRRYLVYNNRTIMDSRPKVELRLLLPIHKEESVPSLINILEAFNHTQPDPIAAYVLHLVELIGRSTPLFISHKSALYNSSKAQISKHIVNAFRLYGDNNKGTITLSAFTSITPVASMYDEVCKLALEKRASLIILPFHEQGPSKSTISENFQVGYRPMNLRVLENAPCSVGIFVERGLWNNPSCALSSWSPFRVAVLFLGGPHDREALALGVRMSGHPKVNLIVIRLVSDNDEFSEKREEMKLDNDMISSFRYNTAVNDQVKFIEETVEDGTGTLRVIQSLEDGYQLILVGRQHEINLPALKGLAEWNKFKELGTIGDLLASQDFKTDAIVLVLQQHVRIGNGRIT